MSTATDRIWTAATGALLVLALLALTACGGRQSQTYVDTYWPSPAQISAQIQAIGDTPQEYQEIQIDHVTLRLHPLVQARVRTSDQVAPSNPADGVALRIDEDGMQGTTGGSRGSTSADLWSSWAWQFVGILMIVAGGVLALARRAQFGAPWIQAVTNATPRGTGRALSAGGLLMIFAETLAPVVAFAGYGLAVIGLILATRWAINARRERQRQAAEAETERYAALEPQR